MILVVESESWETIKAFWAGNNDMIERRIRGFY
jgi:hypothetical protein